MEITIKRIDYLCGPKLSVYTVKKEGYAVTEYELFTKDLPVYRQSHPDEVKSFIDALDLMKERGAKKHYFKPTWPQYLPKMDKESIEISDNNDYGTRLYVIRLRDDILILLNGGIKTTLKGQDCPKVGGYFKFTKKLEKKIDSLLVEKEIDINNELHDVSIDL